VPKISAPSLGEHRAETIDRLIDAYAELVLQQGYASVSLADVAAKAGLARTAIYNYFPDREALLFAWTHRDVQRTLAELDEDLASASSSAQKLRAFVGVQMRDFATRHLPPGQQVVQLLNPETYQSFMQHLEPIQALLRQIVSEGIASGEFNDLDPAAVLPMIMACIGAERGPITAGAHSVEDATDRVADFLLRALERRNPPKPKKAARKAAR
jgi:AcrR family transcriptional regulator